MKKAPRVFSSSSISMIHHEPGSIVVGVDVGGLKKGFHAVALQDGQRVKVY